MVVRTDMTISKLFLHKSDGACLDGKTLFCKLQLPAFARDDLECYADHEHSFSSA